ncbi:MAG: histidine phosphatase family protein [Acidimicrobiia bacterium]
MPNSQGHASSLRSEWARPGRAIWLVRHAETSWSASGRLNGWSDIALSDQGRIQAVALHKELAQAQPTQAWTSDLLRCRETAKLAGLKATADTRLRELDFGELEGATWSDLSPNHRQSLVEFDRFVAPGGESVTDLRERVHAFLSELESGRHVVVTHGGVIRLICRELGRDQQIGPGTVIKILS